MRQAGNTEAEERCYEIRRLAERRAGQLLEEMEKAKGARGSASNQYQKEVPSHDPRAPKTLSELGITYDQSSQWKKLAKIDDAAFDAAFAKGGRPSIAEITGEEKRALPVDNDTILFRRTGSDQERFP
jgi:hypothetical protein